MSYETDTAGRYRARAAQLRSMAMKCHDPQMTKSMETIAQQYESMARVFDDIDQAGLSAIRARNAN
jgi:hypothetical protein